jgi:hypothetical protein
MRPSVGETKLESNRTRRRSDNCYAKGARRAGQGRASGEPKFSERTLDAPKRSRKIADRSDADFALQKTRLISASQDSNQIGKYAIRLVHSSDPVAAQMRISESAASLIARLCGTTMSPGLVFGSCELPEMGRHCRLVLGDKNAPVLRRNGQHGRIVDTGQTVAVAVRKSISGVLRTTAATMI